VTLNTLRRVIAFLPNLDRLIDPEGKELKQEKEELAREEAEGKAAEGELIEE